MKSRPTVRVAVVVAAALLSACATSDPHGDPDPGGKRLAELAKVAHEALPSGAISTHLSLSKSKWGHGGCDGGPPGWTNMEAVQVFHASGNVVAEIDANMRRLHWSIVSKLNTSPAGQPPSTAPGPNAPWTQEYQPSSDPDAPIAWLYTPAQAGGSVWELDLVASPAEVPDHDC